MKKIKIKKYTENYFSKFIDLLYSAKSSKISEFYEARLLISKAKSIEFNIFPFSSNIMTMSLGLIFFSLIILKSSEITLLVESNACLIFSLREDILIVI